MPGCGSRRVGAIVRRVRGEEVNFEVTGDQHYGVLIMTESGERGWVEEEYLSDTKLKREEWPRVGTSL